MTAALRDQLAATTRDGNGELPDLFENTVHLVQEIGWALSAAQVVAVGLAVNRLDRSLDGMAKAHIELEKHLGASRLLSESLGRVIQFHTNRRKAES